MASLNLGGRNTNPLEFALRGDNSELALEAVSILRRAERAIVSAKDGPAHMPSTERELVEEILAGIYDGAEESASLAEIKKLFRCETWAKVMSHVKTYKPEFFNSLNLCTLTLKRPSVWEDPSSCRELSDTREYLLAWKEWYLGLDRMSKFWLEVAPRSAQKRNLEVEAAFAGLLLFDVMSLCSAQCVVDYEGQESVTSDAREIPFKQIARFASKLPASSIKAKHNIAEGFLHKVGAHVFFAQEARDFANHPNIVEHFWPPFCAGDGFTCVFVRKDAVANARDITEHVGQKMEDLVDVKASAQARKAWRTTARRLAAVQCEGDAQVGGFRMCLVSLHCSQSEHTANFLEGLRHVLSEFQADINIVGMDSNCSGREAADFQRKLWSAGFEIGCQPGQDQVTVVKQRTCFQTQVKKAGETDISHKDYMVSWGSPRIHRAGTTYRPDLHSAYGVERESKRCVRLPTTQWPFDHCAVVTHFEPRRHILARSSALLTRRGLASLALVCFTLAVILMPLASPVRKSPYGQPGTWHVDGWDDGVRVGLCEAASEGGAPSCAEGWEPDGSSCYAATETRRTFDDAQTFCREFNGSLVTIGSETENDFVAGLCPEGEFCWIGMRGKRWLSGEPISYFRLVEFKSRLPLLRRSQRDNEPAVLTAVPGEISGCHPEYLLVPTLEEPVLAIVACALFTSTVILVLPRPPRQHRKVTVYMTISYLINLSWYCQRILGLCFASSARVIKALLASYIACDTLGRTSNSLLAYWIILARVGRLRPARAHTAAFVALVCSFFFWVMFLVLFIDLTKAINLNSVTVVLFLTDTGAIFVFTMIFGGLICSDLYRIWDFMSREAACGCSREASTDLSSGVRSAKIHFLSASLAISTGALRTVGTLSILLALSMQSTYPTWARYMRSILTIADAITNDLCAYFLAVKEIDDEVGRARGITMAIAERARREVEQHRLAVRLLKAAPTSQEQLAHLAELETAARSGLDGQEKSSFLILQSVVRVETARIHRLMHCVRARSMTMPLRYQYLLDIPQLDTGAPRQPVPGAFAAPREQTAEAAAEYFEWLYAEAGGAQQALFQQVRQLLAKFNQTPWPSDLGLETERFPWTIWARGPRGGRALTRLHHADVVSPGDILLHAPPSKAIGGLGGTTAPTHSIILEECASTLKIHRSGSESPEDVPKVECRQCGGGGVFIPGPKKKRHRCLDKIAADYEGRAPWPAAASLVDICRCMILLDDPYAVAVLVAYIQSSMNVVRLKNRFSEDLLELVSPEELQAMFYTATDLSDSGSTTTSSSSSLGSQYRDVSMSVVVPSPNAAPIVCEIQVTLANLAILKHADTKLYTIRRMQSPEELRTSYVFSERAES